MAGWASLGFPIYVVRSAGAVRWRPPANFKVRNCRYDKVIATSSVMLVERLIRPERGMPKWLGAPLEGAGASVLFLVSGLRCGTGSPISPPGALFRKERRKFWALKCDFDGVRATAP